MQTKRYIQTQMDDLADMRAFVQVYEEMAAVRMQKIRESVVAAREFSVGLEGVFAEIRSNYRGQVGKIMAKSRLNRNGRIVAVFISANSGLYGDIINRTWEKFHQYVGQNKADAVIVGKQGLKLQQESKPEMLFNYFDLADDRIDEESLGLMMRYLLQFEKILVFYGRFKSIINQEPTVTSVSGDQIEQASQARLPDGQVPNAKKNLYLFEPGLEEVLGVFESQIMTSIFQQSLYESQLAKFASRLMHLDRAVENVDRQLDRTRYEMRRLSHKIENKRQLTRLAGMSLWG